MRILFLTPLHHQNRLFESDSDTSVPELPPEMAQYYWVKALRNQGHDVKVVRYTDWGLLDQRDIYRISNYLQSVSDLGYRALKKIRNELPTWVDIDRRVRNKEILRITEQYEPELTLIVGKYNELLSQTVKEIRTHTDGPMVATNGVGPHDWGRDTVDKQVAPSMYDAIFVNDRYRQDAWRAIGANAVVLPCLGCDIEHIDSVTRKTTKYSTDVSFIGQPYPRRVEYLETLSEMDIDLSIYGPRWESTFLKEYHRGEVWGDNMWNAIRNSKISINIHHRTQLTGGNMKLFEIPGAETMQIADATGDGWFREGKEIVTVDTPEELRGEVEYYLKHNDERKQIAAAGRNRIEKDHTYEKRMRKLIELSMEGAARKDNVVDYEYLEKYQTVQI